MAGFNFDKPGAQRIVDATRHIEQRMGIDHRKDGPREAVLRRVQCVLVGDLDGTDDYNVPVKGRAKIKVGLDGSDATGDGEEFEVWNRFSTSYADGQFAHAVEVDDDDKWYLESGGGAAPVLSWGIVEKQCNDLCKTYIVRRVTRTLKKACDDATGTGSGS